MYPNAICDIIILIDFKCLTMAASRLNYPDAVVISPDQKIIGGSLILSGAGLGTK